jgi:ribose transport system permease protein
VQNANLPSQSASAPRRLPYRVRPAGGLRLDVFALMPYIILAALIAAVVALNTRMASLEVLETKLNAALPLIFIATGQAFVILTGGIDLSVGAVLSVATAIAATRMGADAGGGTVALWTVGVLLFGLVAGTLNGLVVTHMRVTPFIATLATSSVWAGVALLLLPMPGGTVPDWFKSAVQYGYILGLPKSLWVLILLIVAWLLVRRTRIVTRIHAVGSNRYSAYLSGAPIKRTLIAAYAISGLCAAMGGLYRTINLAAGSPTAGDALVLTSAAAVIMGGMSLSGGRGGIVSSIVGACIMLEINDLDYFLGVSTFYTPMVQGVLLIFAVAIQSLGKYLRTRRLAQ